MPRGMTLTGVGADAGAGLVGSATYALLDRFTTDAAAPLTTPRTAEPGPGTLTVVDSNNIMSIASGRFTVNGSPVTGNGLRPASAWARQAGRAFLLSLPTRTTMATGIVTLGLASSATDGAADIGFSYNTPTALRPLAGSVNLYSLVVSSTEHQWACVMRGTGGYLFYRDGTSGPYTLLWVYNTGTAALFSKLRLFTGTSVFTTDDWRVTDLPAPFLTEFGIATDVYAVTGAGYTANMTADAMVEHTIVAATGVTQDLMIRRTDDNNCWIVRCDQTGSVFRLFEKVAGVETQRATAAQTWTNAVSYRVSVICVGTSILGFVDATASKWTYTGAVTNQTATGAKVSHAGTVLACWPRTVTIAGDP